MPKKAFVTKSGFLSENFVFAVFVLVLVLKTEEAFWKKTFLMLRKNSYFHLDRNSHNKSVSKITGGKYQFAFFVPSRVRRHSSFRQHRQGRRIWLVIQLTGHDIVEIIHLAVPVPKLNQVFSCLDHINLRCLVYLANFAGFVLGHHVPKFFSDSCS